MPDCDRERNRLEFRCKNNFQIAKIINIPFDFWDSHWYRGRWTFYFALGEASRSPLRLAPLLQLSRFIKGKVTPLVSPSRESGSTLKGFGYTHRRNKNNLYKKKKFSLQIY